MGYPYQSKRRNVLNNDYNKEQNDKNDDNKIMATKAKTGMSWFCLSSR